MKSTDMLYVMYEDEKKVSELISSGLRNILNCPYTLWKGQNYKPSKYSLHEDYNNVKVLQLTFAGMSIFVLFIMLFLEPFSLLSSATVIVPFQLMLGVFQFLLKCRLKKVQKYLDLEFDLHVEELNHTHTKDLRQFKYKMPNVDLTTSGKGFKKMINDKLNDSMIGEFEKQASLLAEQHNVHVLIMAEKGNLRYRYATSLLRLFERHVIRALTIDTETSLTAHRRLDFLAMAIFCTIVGVTNLILRNVGILQGYSLVGGSMYLVASLMLFLCFFFIKEGTYLKYLKWQQVIEKDYKKKISLDQSSGQNMV